LRRSTDNMHAHPIVQRFLDTKLPTIHAARRRVLGVAVAALMQGHWLSLSRLARGICTGAGLKAALKRIDRLIGHARIAAEAEAAAEAILARLKAAGGPLWLVVDWSAVGPGGAFVELRAAVSRPGRGRAITVYQRVYPLAKLGNARVERAFLGWIGRGVEVIVITDAGFRRPWFAHVERLGWGWIGRVRRGVHLGYPNGGDWYFESAAGWFTRARAKARRFIDCRLTQRAAWPCDVVLVRRRGTKRRPYRCPGHGSSPKAAREARVSAKEPWLLVHSGRLRAYRPEEIVACYATRMQIEENFRDGKSLGYGMGQDIARALGLALAGPALDRDPRRLFAVAHRPARGSRRAQSPLQGHHARSPRTLDRDPRAVVVRFAVAAAQ
jgi:hypothetical protein